MSRSHKRRPFAPLTGCESEATLKRAINRKFRRTNRVRIAQGAEYSSELAMIGEVLDFDYRRGKEYHGYIPVDDPYRVKAMRK